jgi:hypothetical protein
MVLEICYLLYQMLKIDFRINIRSLCSLHVDYVLLDMMLRSLGRRLLREHCLRVTGMDICRRRMMIAVGASDMSVHVFTLFLQVLSRIAICHLILQRLISVSSVADFMVPQIAFNPKRPYLTRRNHRSIHRIRRLSRRI